VLLGVYLLILMSLQNLNCVVLEFLTSLIRVRISRQKILVSLFGDSLCNRESTTSKTDYMIISHYLVLVLPKFTLYDSNGELLLDIAPECD